MLRGPAALEVSNYWTSAGYAVGGSQGGKKSAESSRLWRTCPLLLAQMSCAVKLRSTDTPPAFYDPKL